MVLTTFITSLCGAIESKEHPSVQFIPNATEPFRAIRDDVEKNVLGLFDKQIAKRFAKDVTVSIHTILWQLSLRTEWQLQEEAIAVVKLKRAGEKTRSIFIYVHRLPVTTGQHEWRFNVDPIPTEAGPPVREWEEIEEEAIVRSAFVLRWMSGHHVFENRKEWGNPIIQRIVFLEEWTQALGRQPDAEERKVLISSRIEDLPMKEEKQGK